VTWDDDELRAALAGRRVLLTGHTGFKGGWLAHWLLRLGAEVHGLALPPDTSPDLFSALRLDRRLASHTTGDVRDPAVVASAFRRVRPEVVFHLAAQPIVLRSYEDPAETFATNVMGTVHVLDGVRATPEVRALVNVTSDKCYENREWVWGYRENDPMGGADPYSASKGAAELVFASYLRSYFAARPDLGAVSVRAGNVIGGGDFARDRIVPDAVRALAEQRRIPVRRPASIRPWQHVLEPLGGYLLLAARLASYPKGLSGGWNFGPRPDNARPVAELVAEIVRAWGQGGWDDVSRGDAPHEAHFLRLDVTQAAARLGWAPRWDLRRTIEATVGWYRAQLDGGDLPAITDRQIDAYLASDAR
jgi:CDP-glucose 4,6-dehydratase